MFRQIIHPEYKSLEPFISSLPGRFGAGEGETIHRGRNELRRFSYGGNDYAVKSFGTPHLLNRFAYARIRASKAKRSYWHALELLSVGVNTPKPVAFIEEVKCGLLRHSFYVCLLSTCSHTYGEFLEADNQPYMPKVMRAVGELTARLHNHGYVLRDYSRGNILFDFDGRGGVRIELVDLNRMTVYSHVSLHRGCLNFCRLPATPRMHRLLAQSYAAARGFDAARCLKLITEFRKRECQRAKEKY